MTLAHWEHPTSRALRVCKVEGAHILVTTSVQPPEFEELHLYELGEEMFVYARSRSDAERVALRAATEWGA